MSHSPGKRKGAEGDEDCVAEITKKIQRTADALPLVSFFLGSDVLIRVMSFTELEDILRFRCVSKLWREAASNDVIWFAFFSRDFGELHSTPPSSAGFWFFEYLKVAKQIPRIISAEEPVESRTEGNMDAKKFSVFKVTEEIIHMELRSGAGILFMNVHQLCALLGALSCSKYIPRPRKDTIRVGVGEEFKSIPMSRFCYAVLEGTEEDLWESEEEYESYQSDEDEDSDPEQRSLNQQETLLGISPEIEGEFTPYIFLKKMVGKESSWDPTKPTFSPSEKLQVFKWDDGRTEEHYQFAYPFDWAPHVFSQNSQWGDIERKSIITAYSQSGKLVVMKRKDTYKR